MPRRLLITGGSGTIGSAIARHAMTAGHAVVVASRSGRPPADTPSVTALAVDVRDPAAVRQMADEAATQLGGLDGLILAAGVWAPTPLYGDATVDDAWDEVVETMLSGAWWTIRAALPHLADGGRIVVVTPGPARTARAQQAAFAAAAHGLVGLVRSLALEVAPRQITVNAVAPAWVPGGLAAATLAHAPTPVPPDWTEAEAVAQLVDFLCCDVASGITAQVYGLPGIRV